VKKQMLFISIASVVLALVSVSLALGTTPRPVKFSAALNIGQEVPHPKGTKVGASGRFTATLTGTTLKWTLSFSHLSGPAMAAHIHMGARRVSGPVIVPLCGPCHSPESGSVTVTTAEITAMKAGKTYTNVHTAKNPAGEIRGQITRAL
jgi:hypothetical protein